MRTPISIGTILATAMLAGCARVAPPSDNGSMNEPDPMQGGDNGNDNVAGDPPGNVNDNAEPDGGAAEDWTRRARFEPFDAQFEDLFGDVVHTSSDQVIVGTQHKNTLQGIADVFIRFGGEWRFHARLVGGEARFPEQGFGSAVAISNIWAFVGALKYDIPGSFHIQRGGVYVFENLGAEWQQRQLITIPDGEDFEYLGSSLAFEPDQGRLVIGAMGRARSQGAAYVYVTNGTTFSQQARLMASDGINFENFGAAVATQGQTIAVGAPVQNFGTGAVYVYEREAEWTEHQKILAPDGTDGDHFGDALALDGDTLVISAPAKKRPGDDLLRAGAVYIYERIDGMWSLHQTLVPDDHDAGIFGDSIALENGVLVIAVPSESEAVILEQVDGRWTEVDRVSAENEVFVLDSFGNSMALTDGTLVIGARSADSGGFRAAGAAFVFEKGDDTPDVDDGIRR